MLTFVAFLIVFIWLLVLQADYNEFKTKVQKEKMLSQINNKSYEDNAIIEPHLSIEEPSIIKNETPVVETQEEKPIVTEEKEQSDFEKMFLGNIFNKIGALSLIVGFGIFVKLVSPYIVFTPPMQISTGFIAGLAMILGAFKLHKNEMKSYAEVLLGTGFAIVFISTYCATSIYHLFPVPIAFMIGIALIAATYFIADRFKSFATMTIGLIGGYLNPFLINSDISANFLFGYLIFLNFLSIIYVNKNPDKSKLNFTNLIVTSYIVSFFSFFKHFEINIILPTILWITYLANDLLLLKKEPSRDTKDKNNILGWLNFLIYGYFARIIFHAQQDSTVGYIILGAGLIYLMLSFILKSKNNELFRPYLYSFLISVVLVTYFLLADTPRVVAWAIEGLIIALFASKFNLKYLSNWVLSYSLISITAVFFVKNAIYYQDIQNYIPLWNFRTILFGVPIITTYLSSLALKKNGEDKISQVLKFVYISMIYLFATFELNLILTKMSITNSNNYSIDYVKYMSNTIIGFIYAMQMKRINNYTQFDLFKFASYFLFVISLLALVSKGYAYSPIDMYFPVVNIRFITFLFAIASSLMYLKWTKSEAFNYLAILLGFLLIHVEANDYFAKNMMYDQTAAGLSVAWLLYAGIIMLFGILKNIKPLKLVGIWITIVAIIKILFFDLANMDSTYKTIAFLTTGVVLMIVSYFYTKRKEK